MMTLLSVSLHLESVGGYFGELFHYPLTVRPPRPRQGARDSVR
jgi:hypothetical protein